MRGIMEVEKRISSGASCFLVKDNSLLIGWDAPIYKWLKSEGFSSWGRKGVYNNVDWVYINIYSKIFAPGMPGIPITSVVGDHAITFEEFLQIYKIYTRYSGLGTLCMNSEEQKARDEKMAKYKAREAQKDQQSFSVGSAENFV